jgi:hypothetical protein
MVKLSGGPGDTLDSELRLRLLEPAHRVVDPEQGELHGDLIDRIIGIGGSHDDYH